VVGDNNQINLQGFFGVPLKACSGCRNLKGGRYSLAMGINASGLIVGYSTYNSVLSTHAVMWVNGKILDLGTLPGGSQSSANAINASGQVVGGSNSSATQANAFVWSKAGACWIWGFCPRVSTVPPWPS